MGGSGTSPCASCRLLRRRCTNECVFAPYFPADNPQRFVIVHKIFGASNVSKMLQEIPLNQRWDAVNSLVYEANTRVQDPVYGCVGVVSCLQKQVSDLQMQLSVAKAEIQYYCRMHNTSTCPDDLNHFMMQDHHDTTDMYTSPDRDLFSRSCTNNDYSSNISNNHLLLHHYHITPSSTNIGGDVVLYQECLKI